jgi:hypothetical protein
MSRDTKGFAPVTDALSGKGAIHADRLAKRAHDPAPGFDIASIVAAAPEILDGMYGGLEDAAPSLDRRREMTIRVAARAGQRQALGRRRQSPRLFSRSRTGEGIIKAIAWTNQAPVKVFRTGLWQPFA